MKHKTTSTTLKLCAALDEYIRRSPKRPETLYISPHQMLGLWQEKERGSLPLYIELSPEGCTYRGIRLEDTK